MENNKNSKSKRLLYFFYPKRCPFCRDLITPDENACEKCKKEFPVFGYFQGVRAGFQCCSPLIYTGKAKRSMLSFKFRMKKQYAKSYAVLLYEQIKLSYPDLIFDYITYVPMYKADEEKRGYNQSYLLAKELSLLMKTPCIDAIQKIKHTKPQHNLSAKERRKNLRGAFKLTHKNEIKGRTILLIDDIVTTGSTLYECTNTMQKAKPERVFCATVMTTAHLY